MFKKAIFHRSSWIVILTTAAVLAAIVFFRPWQWDATSYHLPFSARQLGISRYRNISHLMDERFQGFPELWRYALAPGLLLDIPRLLILPNLIAAFTVGYTVRKLFNIKFFTGVAATLCFPIAILGFASAYPDYFTNCFALAGALFLSHWMFLWIRGSEAESMGSLIPGLTFLAIAANTKTQGFLLSVVILATTVIYGWTISKFYSRCGKDNIQANPGDPYRKKSWSSRRHQLVITAILLLLIFKQPLANIYRFQNPFYPVSALGLKGPQVEYSTPLEYLPRFPIATNILSHYLSASEIDPYLLPGGSNIPPKTRRLDMHSHGREVRTGGTIGIIYLGLLSLLILNSVRVLRSGVIANHEQSLSVFLPLLSISTAMLPQSLELRYYLASLFVVSIGSLLNPINVPVQKAAQTILIVGLIASVCHLGLYGRGLVTANKRFNLKAELPTVQECIQKGKLISVSKGQSVLILDPNTVSNNIPFQCRLVMPESTFIDYTTTKSAGN